MPDRAAIAELVRANLPLARDMARRRLGSLPQYGDMEAEVHSAALGGLFDAARRFDQAKGILFRTYARHRIRGAISDYVRTCDHLTKHYRQAAKRTGIEAWRLPISLDDEDAAGIARGLSDQGPGQHEILERRRQMEQVEAAARTLPERLQEAMALRYGAGLNLKEIGAALGYTESRACQVMAEAHEAIRAAVFTGDR